LSARSYLYVPGDQPDKLAKALTRGADAIILDLEDAVPLDRKDQARAAVAGYLSELDGTHRGSIWVRVNPGALLEDDVVALSGLKFDGVSLPKASVDELARLHDLLRGLEVAVMPLVETADGVLHLAQIAAARGVARLQIGEADLAAQLGVEPSEDGSEFAAIRSQVIVASAAAGIEPPVGPVSTDFHDTDALAASTLALRRMGFGARAAIHPRQVAVINTAFTPTQVEVAAARDLIERFESAGGGVVLDAQGRMVDDPIVRSARRVLARADLNQSS
jgi:citrate lyase subunit beta / citryl-CoA lyase